LPSEKYGMIIIEENYALRQYNTFGIAAKTKIFAESNTPEDIRTILGVFRENPLPKLILGGGSNILFTKDFDGIVIYPGIKGKEIVKQTDEYIWVKAYAGENWDEFVAYCVSKNWGGIENLSLIPGNVGACPIQNIGAYGVEVKDVIDSVETIDITTGDTKEFSNADCNFGYRDSIFKNTLRDKYLIVSVTFKLSKNPVCIISYKDVNDELKHFKTVDISKVRNTVINIRRRKLPDPEQLGNAGSFFKNPMIETNKLIKIKEEFPDIPSFEVDKKNVKIPAAWLIQTCGWKGKREGNTGCHPNQPLVLINYGEATGMEIFNFAQKIQQSVFDKFSIQLDMEVKLV
jgi:UDP-N-acetylmuramate dehydrogenase